jgi:hypothetical protein
MTLADLVGDLMVISPNLGDPVSSPVVGRVLKVGYRAA